MPRPLFLFETLPKFDHTRGNKAFSYFNQCAKNWVIQQQVTLTRKEKRHVMGFGDEGTNDDEFLYHHSQHVRNVIDTDYIDTICNVEEARGRRPASV